MAFFGLDLFKALSLGLIAGLTEFLPVSTAAHLLFAQRFGRLDAQSLGAAFVPLIELAALAALLLVYGARIWRTAAATANDPAARRFAIGLLLAFLPSAVFGALVHDIVRGALFNVWAVAFALIVGGGVLLWAERLELAPRYHEATKFPLAMCLLIGLAQCAALIPGLSRAGVSIVAALLLGADRRSAADFSLWLAMPGLAATLAYDLYRNPVVLGSSSLGVAVTGFAAAFLAAWCVARTFLDFASSRGFAAFAWWRVILGSLALIGLALGL
ncbi:MAG TPA: undecaprenyl-diphosphate phosphatase [Xanthobacteraceae bacterium]|jgi:undecaprenyl-diphosphatase|nr:undecaprenyl-diphosphate phosphatase [Xanthobacteraceae bacterium]